MHTSHAKKTYAFLTVCSYIHEMYLKTVYCFYIGTVLHSVLFLHRPN